MANGLIVPNEYKYGFSKPENYVFKSRRGLNKSVVEQISEMKGEPEWMREFRLRALSIFESKKMPTWGADLSTIDFDNIFYYIKPTDSQKKSWNDLPKEIKDTYDAIGIPEAERKLLAGVTAQYESESVYHSFKKKWEDRGVIFLDMDSGLRQYPDLVKQYFGRAIPPADNKFASLNSAVWSGGSFIYVPPGISVDIPLQAYFRINAANMGQFERTLIIVDEGAYVSYIEGCTAPVYTTDSLHAAVVEIFVKRGARCRYTTIQNWSGNVYNLVTKRAFVEEEGTMEWVDANIGSKITMKYPSCYLVGRGARGEVLSLAYAGAGQHQDAGGKLMFLAPDTSGEIISKSVSAYGGRTSYRGLVKVIKNAERVKCNVRCDALILDEKSRSDTYPTMQVNEDNVRIGHEAAVSRIDAEQLFYLMSRGLTEMEATSLIVNGFIEPIVKELPLEYAVELNRLIQLEMIGAVG